MDTGKKNLNKSLANQIQQHFQKIILSEINPWDERKIQHTRINRFDISH